MRRNNRGNIMTQRSSKKQNIIRKAIVQTHRIGTITKIIKLDYIAEVRCWCGNNLTIYSSKSIIENECTVCGSPYKLIDQEWTPEECEKYIKARGLDI